MFIYGPKYSNSRRESHVLLNYLFGQAKMAIWSRKSQMVDKDSTDVILILKGLITSRINIEYSYYKLVNNVQVFNQKWGVNQCISEVDFEDVLNIYV